VYDRNSDYFTVIYAKYARVHSARVRLVLLPGAVVMGLFNPVTGRLFDLYGARYLAIGGFAILTITTYMFTNPTTETTFMYMAILNAVRMLSISMVMMPVT